MRNRREFLFGAGIALGSPRLIGTVLADGRHLPDAAPSLKGAGQSVVVPTHEHHGDIDERIDFPAAWEIQVMRMAGHDAPELSRAELLQRIREPIGTKPLAELASGKKSAVITFDDLARPTPIADIAPLVVGELKAAGMKDEQIVFLGSFGAHRTMEQDEVEQKLGPELVRRHVWFNHNTFDGLKDVGQTSYKNRIFANRLFVGAGLRVTISGVKCHSISGYGGGAKAVLPGVAGLSSIHHNHQVIGANNKTVAELKIFKNEVRLDMAEAARLAGVDFSVQIVYNNRRRACAVFSGDIVEAHTAACRSANRLHRTPTASGADIVVVNTYPQAAQGTKAQAWIHRCVREGGTGVLIMQHPVGISAWHYLYQPGYSGDSDPLAVLTPKTGRAPGYQTIVYSQYIQKPQMNMFPPGTVFAATWDEVVRALNARHKGDSRVAVYPYGTLQHTETDLDG